jgi:hypothetical protein
MSHGLTSLQIRIHQMDGSLVAFTQDDIGKIHRLLDGFQPAQIFNHEKIVVADQNSHTCFAAAKITRIDFDSEPAARLVFPGSLVQAVELTEAEFEALTRNPIMREQWTRLGEYDGSVVVFLDVGMAGGQSVLLTMEVSSKPPGGFSGLNGLGWAGSGLCFRMRTGGVAVLNLGNLTRLTLSPGPLEIPANAWHARFLHTRHPTKTMATGNAGASIPGEPLPISLPRQSDTPISKGNKMRNQHENQSPMERNDIRKTVVYEHHPKLSR